jgi:hypothetical protein
MELFSTPHTFLYSMVIIKYKENFALALPLSTSAGAVPASSQMNIDKFFPQG